MRNRATDTSRIERKFTLIRSLLGITISMVIAFFLILSVSDLPLETLKTFMITPLTSVKRLGYIVEKAIPLLFTGTALCVIYAGGQGNVAVEGAFYLAGIACSFFATMEGIPPVLHQLICMAAAAAIGALVCWLPAWMNVKFGTSTIVVSLMLNYVCQYTGSYIMHYSAMRDPKAGFDGSYPYVASAKLPKLFPVTNIHFGLIIAVLVVLVGYWLLYRNTWGYGVRMVGQNPAFAKFAGINVKRTIIMSALAGGAIAGIGAAVEQLGMYRRMSFTVPPGYGWDGVMIATLSQNNPILVPVSAIFLAYLNTGSNAVSQAHDIPMEIVNIVQSIIIIFAAAEHFLDGFKHKEIVKASAQAVAKTDTAKENNA
ncbi:MAG: ABC transporter permease [Oscillospiraceae bacterium]|nr:ABC transporter permease [Oscillospiraceae bacterium]